MKYPSRYSPGKSVTEAQYIAELMCEKRALSLHRDLPVQFWKLEEWKGYYMYQIRLAYKLLRKYDCSIILKAIGEIYNVFSLANPLLIKKIKILSSLKPAVEKDLAGGREVKTVVQSLRKEQKVPNTLNKLRVEDDRS